MSDPKAEAERRAATRVLHAVVEQGVCVYCGAPVSPSFSASTGKTRHLDHFIPVRQLAIARRWYPAARITNYLLPCCRRCNGSIIGDCLFGSFVDKFDYARWKMAGSGRPDWSLADNPEARFLATLEASAEFRSLINNFDVAGITGRLIKCPERVPDGTWRERKRVLCNSPILFTAQSRTEFCRVGPGNCTPSLSQIRT
jgi:hypothetical protein